jgi:hypothetical protein
MTNSQRLASVRQCLIGWLAAQAEEGVEAREETSAQRIGSESILIRDGYYCGRRFELGDYRAVWFLEEDILKISTADGQLCCVLSGPEITASHSPGEAPILKLPTPDRSNPATSGNERGASPAATDRRQGDGGASGMPHAA